MLAPQPYLGRSDTYKRVLGKAVHAVQRIASMDVSAEEASTFYGGMRGSVQLGVFRAVITVCWSILGSPQSLVEL